MSAKTGRAKPLGREERRAAIMDAAVPLLMEFGREVTSKQLAAAAGIAEGTLYSVFDDKDEIIRASVDRQLDNTTVRAELADLPNGLPLAELVELVVGLMQQRVQQVFGLLAVLGHLDRPPQPGEAPHRRTSNEPVIQAVSELLVPYRDQLAVPPRRAAQLIRLSTFSMTHPLITEGEVVPASEIAHLLLHGFAAPAASAPAGSVGSLRSGHIHPLNRIRHRLESRANMLFRLLKHYLKPYWPLLVGVGVFQLLQSMASLYLPTLNADIIDNGVSTGDTGYILTTGGWMLLITLGQIACSITAVYFGSRAAMAVGRDMRRGVFRKVGEFSEREVSRFGAPSLITRSTNDVQQVQMLVLMSCTLLVSAPILAIGGVIMAMRQDLELSWLIAIAVPVLLVFVGLIVTRMVPLFRVMQKRIDRVNLVLREQLTGIRVIRAFVREPMERARFGVANAEITDTATRAGRLMALMFPIVMAVLNVSSVAVLWFGAFRVQNDGMQVGTLFAFLQYLMQILMSVMMATFMAVMIPRAAVCADRIGEVLDTESSVERPAAPVTTLRDHGAIELDDVSFSYPGADEPVLRHLTFLTEPGTTTAVIGSTGSGKTTLVNLLPRLFDATGGSVRIDGVDVRELDPDLLWSRIGLVPQKPYLFSGTVASNLRYGKPDASDDELWHALEVAQAKDFVAAMPGGLDGAIAQGGTNVSGGQRQRLAIARALVKRPEIYVFDDSFSALDVATDGRLRKALRADIGQASMFVVAQRVSSIADADQILVLEHGEIVARGTHEELIASSPTYEEIVSSQLSAEEAAA